MDKPVCQGNGISLPVAKRIKSIIKKSLLNNTIFIRIINFLTIHVFGKITGRIRLGNHNHLSITTPKLKRVQIKIRGSMNSIIIKGSARLTDCVIQIYGDNNTICIEEGCNLNHLSLWEEDCGNEIIIGSNTIVAGSTHLAAIEGTKVLIGERCLFSSDIVFQTGDAHSILDSDGKRINPSESIVVCNHCWIGTKVIALKGTEIPENSIVGAGSLLTKKYLDANCILAGNPAQILKKNINWDIQRF